MQRVKTIMRVSCMRVGPLALSATIDRSYIYGTDVSRPYFRIWHEVAVPSQAPECPLMGGDLPSGDRQQDGEN